MAHAFDPCCCCNLTLSRVCCVGLQSNLKLDIEIGRITSSMMVENVAAYVRKTVSHLLIKDRDSILYSLKSHRGRKRRRRRGHAIMFSVVQRKLHGF